MLEYHHPGPFPPEGTFVARIASVLQVRAPEMTWPYAEMPPEDDGHVCSLPLGAGRLAVQGGITQNPVRGLT